MRVFHDINSVDYQAFTQYLKSENPHLFVTDLDVRDSLIRYYQIPVFHYQQDDIPPWTEFIRHSEDGHFLEQMLKILHEIGILKEIKSPKAGQRSYQII